MLQISGGGERAQGLLLGPPVLIQGLSAGAEPGRVGRGLGAASRFPHPPDSGAGGAPSSILSGVTPRPSVPRLTHPSPRGHGCRAASCY
ncbi:hypothetical protein HPG69_016738 [Diceros bicornis minor]|uniref:Uncharacterized protein n=1 Tax=Diceros bicornis minor TaxID=77932 RepID=A0A7J7FL82_DICBM|nr:hypothetical protein HPG69_016738 [Diceros bicornis minor]